MAKTLFKRYIWLVDTIYRANGITFKEINERWIRNSMSGGEDLPLKTFNNHRVAIEDIFDINIVCNKKNGYKYYIENVEDMKKGGVRSWLLNTFAVNNLINESHHLKHRILFEQIPSGQKHLSTIIEAMRDGRTLEMTYKSFWKQDRYTIEVGPYFVKIFRQRWYMGAKHIKNDALRIYALDRVLEIQETDYHRLDLSITFDLNKGVKKRYNHNLNISVYNVYCRHNAWMIQFETDPETNAQVANMTYLFSIVPSVTYNFSW